MWDSGFRISACPSPKSESYYSTSKDYCFACFLQEILRNRSINRLIKLVLRQDSRKNPFFMQKLKLEALNRLSVEDFKTTVKTPLVVVLDDVRSALNVGSVFRTADAFACEEVILCGFTATPPHREIMKTALGSTESVAWRHFSETENALNALRTEGYVLVAVEQAEGSIFLHSIDNQLFAKQNADVKIALILGNEVDGVSETAMSMADYVVEVPQFGTKHSLNIAVTAGIVAWEFAKQLRREN